MKYFLECRSRRRGRTGRLDHGPLGTFKQFYGSPFLSFSGKEKSISAAFILNSPFKSLNGRPDELTPSKLLTFLHDSLVLA
jgi:hypothetical protein